MASSRAVQSEQAGMRWHAVVVRASGTRCASYWREEEDLPAPGGLGQPDGLPGERQVSAFSLSLLFVSVFLISATVLQIKY